MRDVIRQDPQLRTSAKFVYDYLERAGGHQEPCCPSQGEIAAACCMSTHTVIRALQVLQARGYVEIVHRGQGKTNTYRIIGPQPVS